MFYLAGSVVLFVLGVALAAVFARALYYEHFGECSVSGLDFALFFLALPGGALACFFGAEKLIEAALL